MIANAELIGLSRQDALRRQMDVIANNLANINTAGFKAERVMFTEYLSPSAEATAFLPNDQNLSYVWDRGTTTDFRPGPVTGSGGEFDVAIEDGAFFAIETPEGTKYTRNGSFQVNTDGTLVTSEGYPVLSDGGPININLEAGPVTIAADGTISNPDGAQGKLTAFRFDSPQSLIRAGTSLFEGENAIPTEAKFTQGALEGSNVTGVQEVTEMIEVSRAYQSLANAMKRLDDLRRDAIQRLGQVTA